MLYRRRQLKNPFSSRASSLQRSSLPRQCQGRLPKVPFHIYIVKWCSRMLSIFLKGLFAELGNINYDVSTKSLRQKSQWLPENWFIHDYLETDLSMTTWKLIYQWLPVNWFIKDYLETDLSLTTWKLIYKWLPVTDLSMTTWTLIYQWLHGHWFINDYMETDLLMTTWRLIY